MPHLLVDISGHGLGHAAQMAAVLPSLAAALPGLRLTLRSSASETALRDMIPLPFTLLPLEGDVGMIMHGPTRVDAEASLAAYAALHQDWEAAISAEAERLRALAPDLLLADVSYLGLAGAQRLGLPNLALCSLNWADILEAYCGSLPGAPAILAQIRAAYAGADAFLRLEPAMPMATLPNTRSVPPVARLGRDRRSDLEAAGLIEPGEILILVSFGGIPMGRDMAVLPVRPGWRWLLGGALPPGLEPRPDILPYPLPTPPGSEPLRFIDLIRSSAALVTKTGYGSFVEATHNGCRLLYQPRPDWPESPWLEPWPHAQGTALAIPEAALMGGEIVAYLDRLLAEPAPKVKEAEGIEAVLACVLGHL